MATAVKRPIPEPADGPPEKKVRSDESDHIVYEPCVVPSAFKTSLNELVEVLVPPKYLVSDSRQVRLRQLWGTDVYSSDSDLVAVLVHTGHVKLKATAPKMPLLVSLRVCPAQATYAGSDRNGLKSRQWEEKHEGVSYKVESCLQHTSGAVPPPVLSLLRPSTQTRQFPGSLVQIAPGPGQTFSVPPAACIVAFSLSNEPWYKYSLALIADQGTDPSRWTSVRMRREALFLESPARRFELALQTAAVDDGRMDKYVLSQVLSPQSMDKAAVQAAGVPLPAKAATPLYESLDWEELEWGPSFLRVRGDELPLSRMLYVPHSVAA